MIQVKRALLNQNEHVNQGNAVLVPKKGRDGELWMMGLKQGPQEAVRVLGG
jgi:hypothetical protein